MPGASLTPEAWPDGARVAVALSFDSDHETIPLRDGETSPGRLAQGEYGARDGRAPDPATAPRAARCPPRSSCRRCRRCCIPVRSSAYVAAGHEVAVARLDPRAQHPAQPRRRARPDRSRPGHARAARRASRPIRHPHAELGLLRRTRWPSSVSSGFAYDSSLMADDEPYVLLAEGVAHRCRGDPRRVDPRRRAVLHDGPLRRACGPTCRRVRGAADLDATSSTRRVPTAGCSS